MDAVAYLIGTIVLFLVGFFAGWNKGVENGKIEGHREGVQDTLKEVDKLMRGGLQSTLDWESSQQMLRERLWKN